MMMMNPQQQLTPNQVQTILTTINNNKNENNKNKIQNQFQFQQQLFEGLLIHAAATLHTTNTTNTIIKQELTSRFQLIENFCKETKNLFKYKELFEPVVVEHHHDASAAAAENVEENLFNNTASSSPFNCSMFSGIHYDDPWYNRAHYEYKQLLEEFDKKCNMAKGRLDKNLILNSMREKAEFFLQCGNWQEALKVLERSRDFCSTPEQIVDVCLNVIQIAILCGHYGRVKVYIGRVDHNITDSNSSLSYSTASEKLNVATGLYELHQKNYKVAAKKFCSVNLTPDSFDEDFILTRETIVLFGTLLALAFFDKDNLEGYVLSSAKFKQSLEIVPWLRDALRLFSRCEYGSFLNIITHNVKGKMLFDVYFSNHIERILQAIKEKCITQCFLPYQSVSLESMSTRFGMTVEEMEKDLACLIATGKLHARINLLNKTLVAQSSAFNRQATLRKAVEVSDEFITEANLMILRMACIENNLILKAPRGGGGGGMDSSHQQRSSYRLGGGGRRGRGGAPRPSGGGLRRGDNNNNYNAINYPLGDNNYDDESGTDEENVDLDHNHYDVEGGNEMSIHLVEDETMS